MAHKKAGHTGKHYDPGTRGTGGKDWGIGDKRGAAIDEYLSDAHDGSSKHDSNVDKLKNRQ